MDFFIVIKRRYTVSNLIKFCIMNNKKKNIFVIVKNHYVIWSLDKKYVKICFQLNRLSVKQRMESFYTFERVYSAAKTAVIIIKIIRSYNNKQYEYKKRLQKDTLKIVRVLQNKTEWLKTKYENRHRRLLSNEPS